MSDASKREQERRWLIDQFEAHPNLIDTMDDAAIDRALAAFSIGTGDFSTLFPKGETVNRRHEWGRDRTGHGYAQCVHCSITLKEAAVIAPKFCL